MDDLKEAEGRIEKARKAGAIMLNLRRLGLASLPESLFDLTHLRRLDLSYNKLTTLSETMYRLTELQELYLRGNDKLKLPPEVLGPTPQEVSRRGITSAKPTEILEYYFRLRGGHSPLNEAKLILVGFGEVGKTSLVNRLVHRTYDAGERKTEGIQITQWSLRLNNKDNVGLNVWDFGGQEIMHSTHQFFLTERSLYLLVLNGRQGREDADAEYWLNLIESFGEESPVIVVLNKIKEHPFDVNRRALKQKFPAVRVFIKTDCEDGTGIDALRGAIERETDRLEHLRAPFPSSWFSIKNRLASMRTNYIKFDKYRDICAKLGETDHKAQESLATYLHNLGIVLNYKEDPRLRDVNVLNPHWVTNGIYTIINASNLEQNKGVLRRSGLARILDPVAYPEDRHDFLLELMRKFELCFPFPEEFNRYLIPELLDKQQAEEAEAFKLEECLNFQYHYPVLPEGLLPRFVVRTNVLSTNQPQWRTGVILQFEGNRALVKADVQDKKVFISVAGPVAGRRRLLAIIRSDFERIHSSFTFDPQEMVPVPGHAHVLIAYQELLVMEQSGLEKIPRVVGDKVFELDVPTLLNGVDLIGVRPALSSLETLRSTAKRVFISYAHEDEGLRNELETHLKLFQRQRLILPWHDRRIPPGKDWGREIDDNLEQADIILLLISADFIASDYCYDLEMKRAIERHDAGEAVVIPIILRDCKWKKAPFAQLQVLPADGNPVTRWRNRDTAWRTVADRIEEVIEKLRGE